MAAINEQLMRRDATALSKIAQAKVRAFDVFYYYERRKENRMQLASYSFGERKYVEPGGILQDFLEKHGSLARLSGSVRRHGSIRSRRQSRCGQYRFEPFNTTGKLHDFRSSEIETFEDHLARHLFGRDYVLCGTILGFGGVKVHISAFVLFDRRLRPGRQEKVEGELVWQLQRDFMNRIIEDYAEKDKELGMVRDLVTQIRHLWVQFGFKGNLAQVHAGLRDRNRKLAVSAYRRLESAYLFYEIAGEILYKLDWTQGANLMKAQELVTYTRLVRKLSTLRSGRTKVVLHGLHAAEQSEFNRIGARGLVYAFVLFVNLWSNAVKSSRQVSVSFKRSASGLQIAMTNDGEMDRRVVRYLNGEKVHKSWKGEGTTHIRTAAKQIDGLTLRAAAVSGSTTVAISVH